MKALSPSKKPKVIIIASVIASALIGASVYAYFAVQKQATPTTPSDSTTIKKEQVSSEPQTPSDLPSKTGETKPPAATETPSEQPEKPTIERAGGDPTIKVVATFKKASKGYCELQLSQPGQQTLSYTSSIVVSASYYACSFTVSRNSLPSGSWNTVVIHHVGEAYISSDSKELQ